MVARGINASQTVGRVDRARNSTLPRDGGPISSTKYDVSHDLLPMRDTNLAINVAIIIVITSHLLSSATTFGVVVRDKVPDCDTTPCDRETVL